MAGSAKKTEGNVRGTTGRTFTSISLFNNCPHCGQRYYTKDAWLLHVGLDHKEIAIRLLTDAGELYR